MLKILFPYKMHLHIFQLEEYKPGKFLKWVFFNFFKRNYVVKKQLVWTSKAKFIMRVALLYAILFNLFLIYMFGYGGLIIGFLLITQPYLFLIFGLLTLKPYEIINRVKVKRFIRTKIINLKQHKLKVIGITGSYGKTSVKEFLYEILKTKYKVLKTPESYNTLFGISKVVDYELDDHYDFFICEMGAYKIGEIREICEMVKPDHTILTGINEQHIDRFKKMENTIKAKFEILKYSNEDGIAVLNGNNKYILDNYSKYRNNATLYGSAKSDYYLKNVELSKLGSKFLLVLDRKEYTAHTKLLGNSNLENVLAAASVAYLLGVKPEIIVQAISDLKSIPHRQEIKTWTNDLTVIDDSYSSNVTGFKSALDLLKTFDKYTKVIATPGIVELGDQTHAVHKELGKLVDKICDKVLLIGKNERTLALQEGLVHRNKAVFITSLNELTKYITDIENTIVLIENDLPDNY